MNCFTFQFHVINTRSSIRDPYDSLFIPNIQLACFSISSIQTQIIRGPFFVIPFTLLVIGELNQLSRPPDHLWMGSHQIPKHSDQTGILGRRHIWIFYGCGMLTKPNQDFPKKNEELPLQILFGGQSVRLTISNIHILCVFVWLTFDPAPPRVLEPLFLFKLKL